MDQLPLVRAANGKQVDDFNLFVRNPRVPDGAFISVNATPLRRGDNHVVGGVAVFRDVSERVLERDALIKAFTSGRIEVIDTILHNIGNAISSVAVGVGTLRRSLTHGELLRRFRSLGDLIGEHDDDWVAWLTSDPQGRQIRPYLLMLVRDLDAGNGDLLKTVRRVQRRVRHIVDIIRTQETFTSGTVKYKLARPGSRRRHRGGSPDTAPFRTG